MVDMDPASKSVKFYVKPDRQILFLIMIFQLATIGNIWLVYTLYNCVFGRDITAEI